MSRQSLQTAAVILAAFLFLMLTLYASVEGIKP